MLPALLPPKRPSNWFSFAFIWGDSVLRVFLASSPPFRRNNNKKSLPPPPSPRVTASSLQLNCKRLNAKENLAKPRSQQTYRIRLYCHSNIVAATAPPVVTPPHCTLRAVCIRHNSNSTTTTAGAATAKHQLVAASTKWWSNRTARRTPPNDWRSSHKRWTMRTHFRPTSSRSTSSIRWPQSLPARSATRTTRSGCG